MNNTKIGDTTVFKNNDLTTEQQKSFESIFKRYMSAKGTDARNSIIMKSVEMHGRCFKVSYTQYEHESYAILDPVNRSWY